MRFLREQLRTLSTFVYANTPAAHRWSFLLFAAATTVCTAVMLWTGPYIQNEYGHDIPVYYGTAWKMLWGYKPHIDFNCTHGVLNFLPVVLGMKLTGANAYSIVTGNTIVFLVVSAMAWAVCRLRFSPAVCLIYALVVGWNIMSAHYLRSTLFITAYAGLYNRQGYALLLILMAQAFLPRRKQFAQHAFLDGAIFGAILAMLFFLKITYFLTGAGLFVLGLVFLNFSWRTIRGMAVGAVIVALPILLYFNFNLLPYFHDLALAGAVRADVKEGVTNPAISVISLASVRGYTVEIMSTVLFLLVMCFLALRRVEGDWRTRIRPWLSFVYVGAIAGMSVCLSLTNSPLGDVWEAPLISATGLLLWEEFVRAGPPHRCAFLTSRPLLSCLIALGLLVPFSARALGSFGYCAYYRLVKLKIVKPEERFTAAPLKNLVLRGHGGDPPTVGPFTYAQKINDGLALLDEHVPKNATVEALDFTNIFPFASGRPPAKGALSWQYNLSFTEEHTLSVERAFGNPDAILVPKYSGDPPSTVALLKIYHDYLEADYATTAESEQWTLLQRRK